MGPRARQITAAFAVLTFVGAAVAHTAHNVTAVHVVCAAHGVVEHTSHEPGPPGAPAPGGLHADPSDEHSDECALNFIRESHVAVISGASITSATVPLTRERAPTPTSTRWAGDVLARAPKTSPPFA